MIGFAYGDTAVTTDARGRFTLENLPAGELEVSAYEGLDVVQTDPFHGTPSDRQTVATQEGRVDEVTLHVGRIETTTVRVVSLDGKPIRNASLNGGENAADRDLCSVTGLEDGRFELRTRLSRQIKLRASAPEFDEKSVTVIGGQKAIELRLKG